MHADDSGPVVKKEWLKPTILKLLADAPPLPNCLEVCFHLHLLHKLYHLKLDIQWVLISFLNFFPGWGMIDNAHSQNFPGLALLKQVTGIFFPSVFHGCSQRIILFRAVLVLPLGQATSKWRPCGCTSSMGTG